MSGMTMEATQTSSQTSPTGLLKRLIIMLSAGFTLMFNPMTMGNSSAGTEAETGAVAGTVAHDEAGANTEADSGAADTAPTQPAPIISSPPPQYRAERFSLSNGAQVILVQDHAFPRITFGMALKAGCTTDPASKEGLTGLTFNLLTRGTMLHNRMEIAEALDNLGGDLDVTVSMEAVMLHGDVLSANMQRYLDLVAELVVQPRFDKEEFVKLRRETISEIKSRLDDDASVAGIHHRRQIFNDHPYARDMLGTMASMHSITREDAIDWYSKHMTARNLIFYVSGDTTAAELNNGLELAFGNLPPNSIDHGTIRATPEATTAAMAPQLAPGRNLVIVDKPERSLSHILIGHPTIAANHPDRYAMEILLTAFGGPVRSRLMEEVREKRGWSYGAYANLWLDQKGGSVSMWTFPSADDTVETVELLQDMFSKLHEQGISQDEADAAMLYLFNSYAFRGATAEQLAAALAKNQILNLPDDTYQRYPEHLQAVTTADLKRVAAEHIHPDHLALTVLCTASQLKARLSRLSWLTSPPRVVKYNH